MPLPNLLATRRGRLAAFGLLYVTEGIPLGFAAVAVATQLRRQDVGPGAIGAFVASLYLPWAFKWAFGPIIDVFAWDRVGRRRGWILATQVLMALTLLSAVAVPLPSGLALFTALLLVHNTFGAMQDVAIDALACNTLRDDERGAANGLMFAGAYLGQTIGGAGVLLLSGTTGFQATFFAVAAAILLVTIFVVLPMREPAGPPRAVAPGPRWRSALAEMRDFASLSFRSMLGSRGAFAALGFALLPAGAMSLGLALQSNLAVELGLTDDQVGLLNLASTIASAAFCVLAGFVSDRLGRRRILVAAVLASAIPVLLLAGFLVRAGWIMPVALGAADRPVASTTLLVAFWATCILYAAINGAMYGVRSAVFMDVTNPAVAATQFTAYMALMNLTIAYTATWQGISIEAWGYPRTLVVDAGLGLVCLLLIPLMRKVTADQRTLGDSAAPLRARTVALGLALALVAWLAGQSSLETIGPVRPILDTFFTLVFVASAVFLAAGGSVLRREAPRLARFGLWLAPALLLLALRSHRHALEAWLLAQMSPSASDVTLAATVAATWASLALPVVQVIAAIAHWVVPGLAALILGLFALRPWRAMREAGEARPVAGA